MAVANDLVKKEISPSGGTHGHPIARKDIRDPNPQDLKVGHEESLKEESQNSTPSPVGTASAPGSWQHIPTPTFLGGHLRPTNGTSPDERSFPEPGRFGSASIENTRRPLQTIPTPETRPVSSFPAMMHACRFPRFFPGRRRESRSFDQLRSQTQVQGKRTKHPPQPRSGGRRSSRPVTRSSCRRFAVPAGFPCFVLAFRCNL